MTTPLGAGKQSKLMAISVVPSFNYVNSKRTRVRGFTLVQTLDNAEGTAEKTTFNGQPAYLLAKTTQPTCIGDEAGWAGGVKSGTVGGEVKPTSGSSSILVEGKQLVREGDTCTMNNGNTVGKFCTVDSVHKTSQNKSNVDDLLVNVQGRYDTNSGMIESIRVGNGIDKYDIDNIMIDKVQELENIRYRTTATERFLGENRAMEILLEYDNDAGKAWSWIRGHRDTYRGLREYDRNAEHYLYALEETRNNPTLSNLVKMDLLTHGYSGVKSTANFFGHMSKLSATTLNLIFRNHRTDNKPFNEENPSPFRGSPATIDEWLSGLAGASDGVYGIKK